MKMRDQFASLYGFFNFRERPAPSSPNKRRRSATNLSPARVQLAQHGGAALRIVLPIARCMQCRMPEVEAGGDTHVFSDTLEVSQQLVSRVV